MLPEHWISVDPGDKHVGMAFWEGVECTGTQEFSPEMGLAYIETCISGHLNVSLIVYERFALDSRRAGVQVGSEFLTPQMIGVIKWLGTKYKVPTVGYYNHEHKRIVNMDWYKAITLKEKRKLPWWGQGTGEHCKDAWTVGAWHLHKLGERYVI